VFQASDGADALRLFRRERPDVAIVDIGLPGMDGYEVARVIRGDDALKNAYLVALTGYALPEDVRRAEASGYQAHVAKPPSPGALEELISALPDAPARARTGMAPSRAPAGTHRGDPSA
jgi:two-component system CheB/CheR fusion protein